MCNAILILYLQGTSKDVSNQIVLPLVVTYCKMAAANLVVHIAAQMAPEGAVVLKIATDPDRF